MPKSLGRSSVFSGDSKAGFRGEGEDFARAGFELEDRQFRCSPSASANLTIPPGSPAGILRRLRKRPRALLHRAGIAAEARRQFEDRGPSPWCLRRAGRSRSRSRSGWEPARFSGCPSASSILDRRSCRGRFRIRPPRRRRPGRRRRRAQRWQAVPPVPCGPWRVKLPPANGLGESICTNPRAAAQATQRGRARQGLLPKM